jgi:hypothetical protein
MGDLPVRQNHVALNKGMPLPRLDEKLRNATIS